MPIPIHRPGRRPPTGHRSRRHQLRLARLTLAFSIPILKKKAKPHPPTRNRNRILRRTTGHGAQHLILLALLQKQPQPKLATLRSRSHHPPSHGPSSQPSPENSPAIPAKRRRPILLHDDSPPLRPHTMLRHRKLQLPPPRRPRNPLRRHRPLPPGIPALGHRHAQRKPRPRRLLLLLHPPLLNPHQHPLPKSLTQPQPLDSLHPRHRRSIHMQLLSNRTDHLCDDQQKHVQ